MNNSELLREMIREVIEEDWKSKLAGAALAVCTAAGCSPVTGQGGEPASPADYGIGDDAYTPPGTMSVDFEDEEPEEIDTDQIPTSLGHTHATGRQRQTASVPFKK